MLCKPTIGRSPKENTRVRTALVEDERVECMVAHILTHDINVSRLCIVVVVEEDNYATAGKPVCPPSAGGGGSGD